LFQKAIGPKNEEVTNFLEPSLLEKPTVSKLLKNFPTFYGIPRFTDVFARALRFFLS
jgi:hypothetical protein